MKRAGYIARTIRIPEGIYRVIKGIKEHRPDMSENSIIIGLLRIAGGKEARRASGK